MTREEWLTYLVPAIDAPSNLTLLPSFPRRNARRVVLGELVRDAQTQPVGLVNPTLADSVEVVVVALYLRDRLRVNGTGERLTAHACRWLTMRGWQDAASGRIIPNDDLITAAEGHARRMTEAHGAYPHALVEIPRRATQSTRLLKVECTGGRSGRAHDPYILRMSAAQFERGAPGCGVCLDAMHLA